MFIIIIQTRMGSTRLPGKVLKKLLNKEIFMWCYDRCKQSKADDVYIATSTNHENDILEQLFKERNIKYFRGSEHDLLDRYYQLCKSYNFPDNVNIIRVTSDCPFIDPAIINNMIQFYTKNNFDYIINNNEHGVIAEGSYVEIFNFKLLKYLWIHETDPKIREHATGMLSKIDKYDNIIKIGKYTYFPNVLNINEVKNIKLSIDTIDNYNYAKKIAKYFNTYIFSYEELLQHINNI